MTTETETISQLEDAFENKIYSLSSKRLRWQVTGIGIVFSVIKLMELEVKNLATIAFGIEQGMNSNDIISIFGPPSTKSNFDTNIWFYIERKKTNRSIFKLGNQTAPNLLFCDFFE